MKPSSARHGRGDVAPPTPRRRMKAVVADRFGPPRVLAVREVDAPHIEDHQVLIRVRASSVNPADWYRVTGPYFARVMPKSSPGLRTPKRPDVGTDLAGTIEAVGRDVHELRPGDEVFGTTIGAWAEYARAREPRLALKPTNVSFEEAAAVPVAGLTALQAVRDHARIQPGQKVLVNGAAGGVGTFTVQLAKFFGAEVTAVCSSRNVELVTSLGADEVVDYTQEDFTRRRDRYDVMLDIAGTRSFLEVRRVLTPEATVAVVGAPMSNKALGPLKHVIGTRLASIGRSQTVTFFVTKIEQDDLAFMGELLAAGRVKSVIDRRYELQRIPEALEYLGTRHARGKVVITI